MAYDLLLTNSGDISFIASNPKSKEEIFEFDFHVAPSDSLLFNFSIDNYNQIDSFSNKAIRMKRVETTVETIDEIELIKNPKIGMRVHVKNNNTIYEITDVNEIMYLNNETDENIIITKVSDYRQIETSPAFNFNFYAYTLKNDKTSRTVYEKDYIEQAIRLRLDTETGSIRGNESMGGDLFKFVHSNMQSSKLLDKICNQVKNAISDILPNCEVKAYIINNNYLNYHDSIKIVIVNNEEVYYYYI